MNTASKAPPHEYDLVTLEGLVETVRAYHPGEVVVVVRDAFGLEVKTLTAIRPRLSDDEVFALLAGDSVTVEDGARMQVAR